MNVEELDTIEAQAKENLDPPWKDIVLDLIDELRTEIAMREN